MKYLYYTGTSHGLGMQQRISMNRGYASAESQWKIEWQNEGQIDSDRTFLFIFMHCKVQEILLLTVFAHKVRGKNGVCSQRTR